MVGQLVRRVVGSGVVAGAEEAAVFQVGVAAVCPALPVMSVAQPRRPVAPLGDAALVAQAHRDELGLGEEPLRPADVEDLRVAVEDDRDDPGLLEAQVAVREGVPGPGRGCSSPPTLGVRGW